MLIKITDEWICVNPINHELGIKLITGSFSNTYKVIDKELFFLSVLKYGIEYKYICESK